MICVLVISFCKYSFLKEVWTTYINFDNDVDVNDNRNNYNSLCYYILKDNNDELSKYSDFCMKLMRNLGYFSQEPKFYAPSNERCNIIYNCIYNSINNKKITVHIINKCFKEYTENMFRRGNRKICYRDTYDKFYEDPMNMTLLNIFENNMENLKNIFIGTDDSNKTSSRNFVCECAKIYKHMDELYCHKRVRGNTRHESTCLKLKQFKESYELFRRNNKVLIPNIPSLDDIDNEYSEKNLSAESNMLVALNRPGAPGHAVREGLDGSSAVNIPTSPESTDSSMKNNSTTTICTVAGASSLLVLLYKFSPGRNWIQYGNRRSKGKINNNLYVDRENDLFFNALQGENISSYDTRYNVSYGSA
ncbi:PIR protein [Plasmodium vivax]|uniref:VIR protein n=1 Tax=Plasmodium vivax TaxID=5855 RepID=A0A565A3L5_PLAVI|nr:PIR protein [Plasmodium vivax]